MLILSVWFTTVILSVLHPTYLHSSFQNEYCGIERKPSVGNSNNTFRMHLCCASKRKYVLLYIGHLFVYIFLGTLGTQYNPQLHKSVDNISGGSVMCEALIENVQGIFRTL